MLAIPGIVTLYNNIPDSYSSKGRAYGSNDYIYRALVNELKQNEGEIEEIHLALYLFNNMHLYNELLRLAKKKIEIVVTSIPLAGYDKRKIKDAQNVYESILRDQAVNLRMFPHMYVWYGAIYADGGASYSLHVKAGMINYRNGSKLFLTSGNLAPGNPSHSETAVFMETPRDSLSAKAFSSFFSEIEQRAKPYPEYMKSASAIPPGLDQLFDFCFVGGAKMAISDATQMTQSFFTAPFISIGEIGSNHYARKKLVETISSARKRMLVCSQHSHDIAPFDGCGDQTMINSIIEAQKHHTSMDVRVLKQVSSSGLADKRRAAFVETHLHYAGVNQRVNKLVHDKFVVADDTVVFSTGNFTATQFAWGQREMECSTDLSEVKPVEEVIRASESLFATPKGLLEARICHPRKGKPKVNVRKKDVFSEVNSFMIIRDARVADQMAKYFDALWNHRMSSDVEILR